MFKKNDKDNKNINIAVIRRNGYGDLISVIPVINYLKSIYKNCNMYVFVSERNKDLAPYLLPNDNIVVIKNGNKYFQTIKVALKYRSVGFDIAVAPSTKYIKLNDIFLKVLNAKKSFSRGKDNALAETDIHVSLANLKLIDPKIDKIACTWFPHIDKSLIPLFNVDLPKKRILVSVSNNRKSCQLELATTANILNKLYKKYNFSVMISCLESERDKAVKLIKSLDMVAKEYVTVTLGEFLGLISESDIVFSGEGGFCHLASCFDTKIIALFGHSNVNGCINVKRWGVLSKEAICLYDKFDVNNIETTQISSALARFLEN